MQKPPPSDLVIRREVDVAALAVLDDPSRAEDEGYLEGNRSYADLRGMNWGQVAAALQRERELIARLLAAPDIDAEAELIEEERLEAFEDPLFGLDVGVASATLALSAMGCTPFSSCNGAMLGGFHNASHPVVALYLPAEVVPAALAAARTAEAGLILDLEGRGRLYAGQVEPMVRFAEAAVEQARGEGAERWGRP